ncbi:hypothetical protein ACFY8C_02420 [Streptomyces flavochromogenes]|uniref:Uncharacterized protein n=1 Tax=Streptomyces flavochromogenes TaxID=68199 RepID=A0ABW6XI81_9ACTN|nr:hypothetical protein [Streptomyces flavochromogenes]
MESRPIDPERLAARFARLAIGAALDEGDPDGWPDGRRIIGRAVTRSVGPNACTEITRFLEAARNRELGRQVGDPQRALADMFLDFLHQAWVAEQSDLDAAT